MQEIFNFLKEYWQIILGAILFIVALIIAVVRKKPIVSYLGYLINTCLRSVNVVEALVKKEAPEMKGKEKLDLAVDFVLGALKEAYPGIDASKYKNYIIQTIEEILTTPQKKGV